MSEVQKQTSGRFMALEGLRGIASISVVFWHTIYMFWAFTIVGHGLKHSRFEDNLYGSPLMALISGSWAVSIFFVLSGFVLSIGFFTKGKEASVKSQLARRYFRLMIPAAAACLLAFIIMSLGLNHNPAVNQLSHSAWLGDMWHFDPSLLSAIYDGTLGVFLSSSSHYTQYDPVLWTMHWEFFGSLMVFGFLLLLGKQSKRWLGYLMLTLLLYKTQFLGFLIGMALADLYASGRLRQISLKMAALLLAAATYLGGIITSHSPYYSFLPQLNDMSESQWVWLVRAVASGLVIFVVLTTPRISRLLEHKYISTLGKYTFALYLTHKLVLFSLTGALFLAIYPYLGYNYSAVLAFVASIPAIVGLTVVFERYVDQPSIALARRFSDWFMAEESESLAEIFNRKRYALAARLYAVESKYRPEPEPAE